MKQPSYRKAAALNAMLVVCATAPVNLSLVGQEFLGPLNPGAEQDRAHWTGETWQSGAAAIDTTDPATGLACFVLSTFAQGKASWTSAPFSLGSAAGGAHPLAFSFDYKLALSVPEANNLAVQLRFYDGIGNIVVGGPTLLVGSASGDTGMTSYKTMNVADILVPPAAVTADVFFSLNMIDQWISGGGHFDNFSVQAVPEPATLLLGALAAVGLLGRGGWGRGRSEEPVK